MAVLGATGCVGRHVTAALLARGTDVLAVARRPAPHLGAARFRSWDAAAVGGADLARLLAEERIDVVVNATLGWGEDLHRVNVLLVERLLDALPRLPEPPRLVQLGTVHEYGPVEHGTSIDEDTEPAPRTPYARAKLVASRMVTRAARAGELDGVVLRLANTIGPYPARESFLGSLAVRLARVGPGERIDVTVASAQRDYLDVRDAADAVARVASSRRADPLVNVGRGRAVHLGALVAELLDVAGLPQDTLREVEGQVPAGGADWIQVDTSRATRLLGWRPRFTARESLEAIWATVRPVGRTTTGDGWSGQSPWSRSGRWIGPVGPPRRPRTVRGPSEGRGDVPRQ